MPTLIDHPESFRTGTRVLLLKGRHKDGIEKERAITKISHDAEQFARVLDGLVSILRDGERVYVSAGERDLPRSMRLFKERQLAADYDGDTADFYRHLEARWASCLMHPSAQAGKLWLFDCDTPDDATRVRRGLAEHYDRPSKPYEYASKSGVHIVVGAFDKSRLPDTERALIHENAIMLYAY